MKKGFLAMGAAALLCLAGCGGDGGPLPVAVGSLPVFESRDIAAYYYNYDKASFAEGYGEGITNQLVYATQSIEVPCLLTPPSENPTRPGYDFAGWCLDSACEEAFDFAGDSVESSTFLYAKWTETGEGEYVEPVYTPVESIDDGIEGNLKITGVLNVGATEGVYYLTKGALARLESAPGDVRFALNYTRKSLTSISAAVYDAAKGTITVTSLNGESEETTVLSVAENASSSLVLSNSTYESKAVAYEEEGGDEGNYHIMLAGSSSMEFWDGYERALDPIVAYNHGIGGTTAAQWRDALLERLVVPYRPKAVVYYVGVNDLVNGGLGVETVASNVEELMGKTHERLPETHVFFVYINVLPGYNAGYADSIRETNSKIASFIEGKSWIEGVAAGEALLKESGEASAAFFRADSMHMSEYGYVLWGARIKKALQNWLG